MPNTLIIEYLVTFEVQLPEDDDRWTWWDEAGSHIHRIQLTAHRKDVQEPLVVVHDVYEWEND